MQLLVRTYNAQHEEDDDEGPIHVGQRELGDGSEYKSGKAGVKHGCVDVRHTNL